MSELWQKGLAVLESLGGRRILQKLSSVKAKELAQKCAQLDEDLNSQLRDPSSYLILADQIPRDPINARKWLEETNHYFGKGILPFINDIEDDPHTRQDLALLHHCIVDLGFDPSDSITSQAYPVEHLVLLGCGDGLAVKQLINHFKPKMLTVMVTDWHEWASSFFQLDWLEIWNDYCMHSDHVISAICADHPEGLLDHLFSHNRFGLDHAYVYVSPVASVATKEVKSLINQGLVDRLVAYTGFPMDEYNMIWNTWKTLAKHPKVFHKQVSRSPIGDYLVIGSGPSLDSSLEWIQKHQEEFIIVSCASNFGSLRRAGIEVDVLCLLERGDFMIEQYSEFVETYGAGNTKLFASVTTPAPLLDLFKDSMVYFRPSLTPCSLFSDNESQILTGEGPQTVNTGVAFALSQSPRRIILCGADLGTASLNSVRTVGAIGESPRDFDRCVPGNLRETVYSNDLLLDGVRVLETISRAFSDTSLELINCSDGVKINGWVGLPLDQLPFKSDGKNVAEIDRWWSQRRRYSSCLFQASFIAAQPRRIVFETLKSLKDALEGATLDSWLECRNRCVEILSINNKSNYQQFAARVIRGHMIRLILAINRQLIVLAKYGEDAQSKFLQKSLLLAISRVDSFESEILGLIDTLELAQQ